MVILCGGGGNSEGCSTTLGPAAARQGYHVIGLTYPAARANAVCAKNSLTAREQRDCYGNAFREVVTGKDSSPDPGSDISTIGEHRQDSVVNRLVKVLEWADANHSTHGWNRYLVGGDVDWTQVHLAGHSNGSSHISFMGSLARFRNIGRVALFAGPDDGNGGTTEEAWHPATYIQQPEVSTADRYYGLVHVLNKARRLDSGEEVDPPPVYQVIKNWHTFGMEEPNNRGRFEFDPEPGYTPYFGDAHMLISIDPFRPEANHTDLGTTKGEAHNSVVENLYCTAEDSADFHCKKHGSDKIGYEPAWRCILGTGDSYASSRPVADAGPDQTVECQGNGGANVLLDGSGTRDYDCELLSYAWTWPFGLAGGQNPTVFLPLGANAVTLSVWDGWWWSASPDTTHVTVSDTQPPSLQLTLTPTLLWPANHRLIHINAAVTATDSCGGAPPTIALTSITSNQPDDGLGDGDTNGDIQEAQFGTFDRSFLLRAERAGGDRRGRTYTITYTATDASGNQTHASATVQVPHSR
ncbi:MAG: BPSS1187 family protein [Pyrinomonadaceae bacterium]